MLVINWAYDNSFVNVFNGNGFEFEDHLATIKGGHLVEQMVRALDKFLEWEQEDMRQFFNELEIVFE